MGEKIHAETEVLQTIVRVCKIRILNVPNLSKCLSNRINRCKQLKNQVIDNEGQEDLNQAGSEVSRDFDN